MKDRKESGPVREETVSLLVMILARLPRPPTDDDIARLLDLLKTANKDYVANLCEAFTHALPQQRIDKNDPGGAIRQFAAKNMRLVNPDQVASYIGFILNIDRDSEEHQALQSAVAQQMAGSSPTIKREQALVDIDKQRQELEALVNKIMQGQQSIDQQRTELGEVNRRISQLKSDAENAERDAIATEILSLEKFEVAAARAKQAESRLQEAEEAEAAAFRQLESAEQRIVTANSAAESGRLRDSRLITQALSEVGILFPDNESLAVMADEVNENNAVIVARQLVNDLLRGVISRLTYETRELATVRADLVEKSKELAGLRVSHSKVMQDIRNIEAELAHLFEDLSSRRSVLKQKQEEKLAVVAECDKESTAIQKAIIDAQFRMVKARAALQTTLQDEIAAAMAALKHHAPAG